MSEEQCNPNTLVTKEGVESLNISGSILIRLSPLLAAIDLSDLHIIKLLVENGADATHAPRYGLLRLPLQRAAEIGNFEVVEYLISQGVLADENQFYSGGTALQLAALSGHVGIATYLLDQVPIQTSHQLQGMLALPLKQQQNGVV